MTFTTNTIRKGGFLLLFLVFTLIASAQLSHGGHPLPLQADTRAVSPDFFIDMPPFDVQEARLRSEQNRATTRSLEFGHKFYTFLRPDNSGITFTSGNMNVWRVGIRSQGAYSLNILFSRFRIPRGAKVFVYNADQTKILGSFTHLNNSDLNLLPIQPIAGDALIVEYQEPINASFRGEIEVGEVNHDFIGILRATQPRDPRYSCHPNIVCYPNLFNVGKGVVALIINGTTFCTGVLVNNTAEDGTPYLLTATHCLNNDYCWSFLNNRHYNVVANRIVAFFNYDSPMCKREIVNNQETPFRGQVQMSLASADSVLISERHDISLLRFRDIPPKEFQPYFLGWNVSSASPPASFHGVHHPNGGTKRVAISNNPVTVSSWGSIGGVQIEPNAHWRVTWDVASTEGGSSGSPLLDRELRVLGTLTGGSSFCNVRAPDDYASLARFWNVQGSLNNPNSLRHYLDPAGLGITQWRGFNPHAGTPILRSQNFDINDDVEQTIRNNVPVFSTNNTFGYSEFAEEFKAEEGTQIVGVFIASAPTPNISQMDLQIRIYTGENGPEHLVHEQSFTYDFRRLLGGGFQQFPRDMTLKTENYIHFDKPITVSGRFFVAYAEMNGVASGFSALNVAPRSISSTAVSTAWVRRSDGWTRTVSENMTNRMNTSLLISPFVIGTADTPPGNGDEELQLIAVHSRTEQIIFVESNKELIQWEIFYSNGQRMLHERMEGSRRLSTFVSHWARGVYIVRVRTVDGETAVRRVLVI